jgi:hypothetical protein
MKKSTIVTILLLAAIGTAFALDWNARKKQREILKNASNV